MTSFVSITGVLRSQVEPYQHLAWFLYEAAEREHRLNLEALSRAPGELVTAWTRWSAFPFLPQEAGERAR